MYVHICVFDGEAGCLLGGTNWTFRCNSDEFHVWKTCFAMAQAVSRWSATKEDRVRFRTKPCEFCGEQSGKGTGFFFRVFLFSLSTGTPYLS